jgi:ACS family glucarate transporter-like MFS transporter
VETVEFMKTRSDSFSMVEPFATRVRYAVLLNLCAATLVAYIHRFSIAVAEENIRADLGVTKKEMGWLMGAFFISYAAAQLPAGWLAHQWGTRRLLPICSILSAIAMGMTALASSALALWAGRLGMGAAQAGMLPCATNSVAKWFPATRRGLASGTIGSALSIGGALGVSLTGVLLESMSWRWLFALYALPGLVWAFWFFTWFRDRPHDHPGVNAGEWALLGRPAGESVQDNRERPSTPWLAIFSSPAMGWICGQQLFRAAGYVFYASWFATFLREARDVSLSEAGLLTSLPLCGVVVGGLVGGLTSDRVLSQTGSRRLGRQGIAVASTLLCALCILLARPVTEAWPAVLLLSLGSFCSAIAGPCAYAITIDMGGAHVAPVFSTMNMSGNLGAVLFPILVPWLVGEDRNWDRVLYVFAGIHLAAALCWLCLNPNGTIFDPSSQDHPRT